MIYQSSSSLIAQQYPHADSTVRVQFEYCLKNYPEIPAENVTIRKRKQLIPLTTIPSTFNIFRKKHNWKYKINISTKTIDRLSPIIYDSLSTDAQIGVLSHELSHIFDFQQNTKGYLIKTFFDHLSKKKMDAFEFNTDLITIKKGMGTYLLAWSEDVQKKLEIEQWEGKKTFAADDNRERYMRPETICSYMKSMTEIYSDKLPLRCR